MDSIIWTGTNVAEVEAFALAHNFGFTVGSTYGQYRWYHKVFDRFSHPRADKTVLEIFPSRKKTKDELFFEKYDATHLDSVHDSIHEKLAYTDPYLLENILEIIEVMKDLQAYEGGSWHWTTARPGDKIYADGTVDRYEEWFYNSKMNWRNNK